MINQIKNKLYNICLSIPVVNRKIVKRYLRKNDLYQIRPYTDRPLGQGIDDAFKKFLTPDQLNDSELRNELTIDIVLNFLRFQSYPYEYFVYKFKNLSSSQKKSFATDLKKDILLNRVVGIDCLREMQDKYSFYEKMKEFYGRDVCKIDSGSDWNKFVDFTSKNKKFIVKPIRGSRGQNTYIAEIFDSNINKVFDDILKIEGGVVIEELILQSEYTSKFNPSSVNTVRLPAFLVDGVWTPWVPFFRTGRAGSVVDNAGRGGIIIALDAKTGNFLGKAADEYGNSYTTHPDSGYSVVEGQIPRWEELLETIERAHRKLPHQKYVGWDCALTDKGWVLVEGNWGQPVWQIPMQKGVYQEMKHYLKA